MNDEYHAFLLRLQRNKSDNRWRIVLKDVETGAEQRFVGKRELLTFLFSLLNRSYDVISAESKQNSKQFALPCDDRDGPNS